MRLRLVRYLLGEEDAIRDHVLNVSFTESLASFLLFLLIHGLFVLILGIKLDCSAEAVDWRVASFLKVKHRVLSNFWTVTMVSWILSCYIVGLRVARRTNMRLRKAFYLIGTGSLALAIGGALGLLILAVSPGRVISCEGESWTEFFRTVSSEISDYIFSIPSGLSLIPVLFSLLWFVYVNFRLFHVGTGLSPKESMLYSISFVALLLILSSVLGFLVSAVNALLPEWP